MFSLSEISRTLAGSFAACKRGTKIKLFHYINEHCVAASAATHRNLVCIDAFDHQVQEQGTSSHRTRTQPHHKGKTDHIWDHMWTKPYMDIIYGFQIIYGHRFQIIYGPYMIIYGPYMIIELNHIWHHIWY